MAAVVVEDVGKKFHRYDLGRSRTLKDALLRGLRGIWPAGSFWVLRHVSFRLEPGQALGIIGRNGAGKSTLLRLLGGVGRPDEGQITVHGRIAGLLDLSVGFDQELTGRENAIVSGVVRGMRRAQITAELDAIADFAGLSDVIDQPLRTYSAGMRMRLGFSIAINVQPDVLLIDEVLSVGDAAFVTKCVRRVEELKAGGCTIIGVSHDLAGLERFCDKALLLEQGELLVYGEPAEVIAYYTHGTQTDAEEPDGGRTLEILGVQTLVAGERSGILEAGAALRVQITYRAHVRVEAPVFFVRLLDPHGLPVFACDSLATGFTIPSVEGEGRLELAIGRLDLGAGEYSLDVGVGAPTGATHDYRHRVCSLVIAGTDQQRGVVRPPVSWCHGEG